MNRRIQFRAWSLTTNAWRSICLDSEGYAWQTSNGHPTSTSLNSDYLVIEQFTGLQDKNGKDIYEGDILRYGRRGGFMADLRVYTAAVSFNHAQFILGDEGLVSWQPQCRTFEVIGNIHENPELLSKS